MDILAHYVMKAPADQNVMDLFDGEWSSKLPEDLGLVTRPGFAKLFEDARVIWAERQLGGFANANVLELGPLECGHTFMLQQRGARSITSIEANSRAFLKCLCVKHLLGLERANLLLGDFVAFLRDNKTKFDLVFASGVLYHMQQPMELLDLICKSADRLFIWTHYYDEQSVASNSELAKKFSEPQIGEYEGFEYRFAQQAYNAALDWSGFCGGPESHSRWLSRRTILDFLAFRGFDVSIGFEQTDQPNGPAFALSAKRQ
ncbi:MAG TPA: class I SAM-dependent methyltransferase [Rudaea sp.]|nr:class I SAM-dependent methyltransferase [Rudaea sp.]